VRLTRLEGLDLNLFAFDYDLTFAAFFLTADDKVYARYGGRDPAGPDTRQSLEGLRYTMRSVLAMHKRKDRAYAPRPAGPARTTRQLPGPRRARHCVHCHQVREALDDELRRSGKWSRERAFRYPLPDNLGLVLEVDRPNVVRRVRIGSPAERAGLRAGDVLRRLNGVPVHSLADAQFALDRAPAAGKVSLAWERAGKSHSGALDLPEGWRKGDITWRPSLQRLVPSLPLYGTELTAAQKKALGLPARQFAFRHSPSVKPWAEEAGVRAGDVILGVDDRKLEGMDVGDFRDYVRREYLAGDRVRLNVLRGGKRLSLPATLP
jgi:serine protease Do